MILDSLDIARDAFEEQTGWHVTPDGACKDDRCVPLPGGGARLDARVLADRLGMPLVHDEKHALWSLGPEAGGRALKVARMPPLVLPDLDGKPFDIASLLGSKVLLVAWASW